MLLCTIDYWPKISIRADKWTPNEWPSIVNLAISNLNSVAEISTKFILK
ncbi:hypothetical protein DOY81_002543 [Sarcophaga bullata]|nr:hypothetical protein DOY81_002543 [Sarcophaga bullata]